METYKTEAMETLGDNIYSYLTDIDNKLDKCMDDYYNACETSNMMKDSLALFESVRTMMQMCFLGMIDEHQILLIVKDMIVREMRNREGVCVEYDKDTVLWQNYMKTVEKNLDGYYSYLMKELTKFETDMDKYVRVFESDYAKNK